MKTIYEYIRFDEQPRLNGLKTKQWKCQNIKSNTTLGLVCWENGWRQYIFEPIGNTIFSNGCLRDISEFLTNANGEHKQPTPEGQFATKAYKHYCEEIYPEEHDGDKYAGEGKQDVPYLTRLVKVTKCLDAREWSKRLRRYAQSTSKFHIDNGHRILDFKWNAWSDSAMEKRGQEQTAGESPAYMRGKNT